MMEMIMFFLIVSLGPHENKKMSPQTKKNSTGWIALLIFEHSLNAYGKVTSSLVLHQKNMQSVYIITLTKNDENLENF